MTYICISCPLFVNLVRQGSCLYQYHSRTRTTNSEASAGYVECSGLIAPALSLAATFLMLLSLFHQFQSASWATRKLRQYAISVLWPTVSFGYLPPASHALRRCPTAAVGQWRLVFKTLRFSPPPTPGCVRPKVDENFLPFLDPIASQAG